MAQRFSIERETSATWPTELITLRDRLAGSWLGLLPGSGCNLVSFGARVADRDVEAMLQPVDETPAQAPDRYGAPVLFPFPNRLRGGQAQFSGHSIQIDRAPGQANAIHGLVGHRPFEIEYLGGEADEVAIRCAIDLTGPDLLRQFPFPSRLALTFRLAGRSLRIDVAARNLGDAPMPMGFGWHPFFRLPLIPGSDRRNDVVTVPSQYLWQLDSELLPTGTVLPAPPERDFERPKPLGSINLDDVFTNVEQTNGTSTCALSDSASNISLSVAAGPSFREWVVYAPPNRPTICFEPYTCPTDAFNLTARGLNVGVVVLQPGEEWRDWISLNLSGPD